MQKGLQNKVLAGVLSLAMVIPSSGCLSLPAGNKVSAADAAVLDKILGAEDIDLRLKWNDTSNTSGEGRTVTLSNGDKITIKDNGSVRKDMTAQQLADTEMGVGINLGNTMEAVYNVEYKKNASVTDFETIWGAPVTTREYIDCLHSYGINTLRIPVAWSNGDADDGTYTIRGDLLDRVEEIANYALDNGMYVIINDHWDNQWWGQFGACKKDGNGEKYADEETRAAAWTRYEKYWTQISERFKDYSDHLVFEGANEELGDRLNDSICVNGAATGYAKPDNADASIEVVSGNLKSDELYDMTNKINQKFVDIVRSTGGNNESRFLMIPGYNTDFLTTADERYIMPKDTAEGNGTNKLFLSVHYYTPSEFCLDGGGGTYTTEDQEATKTYFQSLKKFSDAGYGIIIGECGVCNPSGVSGSVTQWFNDTFTEASKYHAVPVLWDTGAYFDRKAAKINYKDIAIFLNTVTGANGSTDVDRETGGAATDIDINTDLPGYIDAALWADPGIHAYVSYQTSTWDYRNAYKPQRTLSSNSHSWEYIQASGVEVSAASAKVTDVHITGNGEYTVAIDGIDLSGANSFKMLSVATDIDKKTYPGITATDATIKIDGKEVTDAPFDLVVKNDDNYYNFMLVNVYDSKTPLESFALGAANENENLKLPSKSIEISFKINGLDKALADIESGEYINQETGYKISEGNETQDNNTPGDNNNPSQDNNTPGDSNASNIDDDLLAKGDTFTSGNYKYKVTKASDGTDKGAVTLTGLSKKGASAKKLSVSASVEGSDGMIYTIKAIGKKAFSGAKAASVTLNKNIKEIPGLAFTKCTNLSTLTLKAKLSKVAKNAFQGCKKTINVKGSSKKANINKLNKTDYKKFR